MTSKRGLPFGDVIERDEALLGLLVVEHGMALREGAAFDILARQADRAAGGEQRAESERFPCRPVDAAAALDRLLAVVDEASDRAVDRQSLRQIGEPGADFAQRLQRHRGSAPPRPVAGLGDLDAGPGAVEPVGLVGAVVRARLELGFQRRAPVGLVLVDFVGGHQPFLDQLLAVDLQRRRVAADRLVHQRLGEGRLVALVVAEAPVAEHVHNHRLVELLAELGGHLGGIDDRFRIVAVSVQDRRLDHLGDVGGIGRGAPEARVGGEPDLVVDDDMDRACRAVTAQARQAEALGDHALAGEGGIAVDEQRQHPGALLERHDVGVRPVRPLVLLGARLAEHHRIDDFQMRRIGGQRQVHPVAIEFAVRRGAEVVLDVAGARHVVGRRRAALEFVEDGAMRLAHHLGEHVEAAAMGHAEHDLAHAQIAAALDDLLQRRHYRFAAVEAEALGAGVLHVDEALEALGLDQLVEDGLLAHRGEVDALVGALDALLDPGLLDGIGDVHELDAERRTVGAPQDLDHLGDGGEFQPENVVEEDVSAPVGLGEAVGGRIEFAFLGQFGQAERVEIGVEMAAHAVGADHHQGAHRIARRLGDRAVADLDAALGHAGPDLLAKSGFQRRPVAVEGGDQLAVHHRRPVRTLPRRPVGAGPDRVRGVLQPFEEAAPFPIDRAGIDGIARL